MLIEDFFHQGPCTDTDYCGPHTQPTLEALVKLAKTLHTSLDSLVFGEQARGPDEDFRLRFEALKDFMPTERSVAGEVLDIPNRLNT